MRLIRFKNVTLIACLLAAAASISMGATIPYIETFDTYSSEADVLAGGWTKGELSGVVGVTATDPAQGAKAGTTALADITLPIGGNYGNVWCRIVTKAAFLDEATETPATPGPDVSVAFYIDKSTKILKAWDGNSWEAAGPALSGAEADWRTLIIHTDYTNEKWDIYTSSGPAYLSPCTRLNAAPLPFSSGWTGSARLTGMTVQGNATLDAIAMSVDHTKVDVVGDNGNKVLVHTSSLPKGVATQVGLPLEGYTDEQDNLAQLVGKDLQYWIDVGDIVKVQLPPTGNQDFEVIAGPDWLEPNPELAELTVGTGVWLLKPDAAGIFVCFVDFNAARSAPPKQIYGSSTVLAGWNNLGWPKSTQADLTLAGLTQNALPGDLVYMRVNGRTQRLFRSNDNRWMLNGTTEFTGELQPFEAFWYYRNGATRDWNIPE